MLGLFSSPDGLRQTRFHDEKGNRIDAAGMVYAPAAFVTAAAKRLFGWRPRRPMISYRAQRVLAARLKPDSLAVEFGSGMSTPWLAVRCGRLVSFEDHPGWAERVRRMLAGSAIDNVDYRIRPSDAFADVGDLADGSVDFALIDGTDREGCARAILAKMRVGGTIYLDNSDKDMTNPTGDLRRTEALLRGAAEQSGWPIHLFTDFSPTNFFAEQGMLIDVTSPWRGPA